MMTQDEKHGAILKVRKLCKSFGGLVAVNEVDFAVSSGSLVAVIGPNGAGKTTLFNLITGYLVPDSGSVLWKEAVVTGLPPRRICKLGISRSFQVAAIYHRLTAIQNVQAALFSRLGKDIDVFASGRKLHYEESMSILESVGLQDRAGTLGGNLSHGDRKRLELAMVLGTRPELLLLDEPTAGMSGVETAGIMGLVDKLNRENGISVLFTEHNMSVVFGVAREILVMHQGAIVARGTAEEIKKDRMVQTIYLGE
jgi:branched-chain amino acid transport system ATP-binding protein